MITPVPQEDPNEQFYRDTEAAAFPKLNDRQLAQLDAIGTRRVFRKGECVFRSGQRDVPMTVIISGAVEVYENRDGVEQILATAYARDFLGDVSMLTGTASLADARIQSEEAELLHVPAPELRRALADLPGLGEPIVNAFIMRRERLKRDREFAGMRIVAQADCLEGRQLDDFLDKNRVPHSLIDAASEAGAAIVKRLNLTRRDLPTLLLANGSPLRRPSLREVAQVAGLMRQFTTGDESEVFCDVAIVGAGPAGLSAALNSASEGLRTVVLESYAPGGQAGTSSLIENYFGFPTGISGGDLTRRAQLQAFRFGAKFSTPMQALALTFSEGEYPNTLHIEGAPAILRSKCVIIATGANYRRIEAEGREDFDGLGVYHAATAMEGKICRGATVLVVGAGNSAGQASMFLSECAAHVILVVRGTELGKSMSSYLSRRVEAKDNIEILYRTEIRKMTGKRVLEAVELHNVDTGATRSVQTPAVFSMIGAQPCTHWLPPEIERDEKGFIKTGSAVASSPAWLQAARPPAAAETSRPGVFAAGDVRSGSVKRCAAAVGEGGVAIEGVHSYLGTYA